MTLVPLMLAGEQFGPSAQGLCTANLRATKILDFGGFWMSCPGASLSGGVLPLGRRRAFERLRVGRPRPSARVSAAASRAPGLRDRKMAPNWGARRPRRCLFDVSSDNAGKVEVLPRSSD